MGCSQGIPDLVRGPGPEEQHEPGCCGEEQQGPADEPLPARLGQLALGADHEAVHSVATTAPAARGPMNEAIAIMTGMSVSAGPSQAAATQSGRAAAG